MVYGLNGIYSSDRTNLTNRSIGGLTEEFYEFTENNKSVLIENITRSMINDDINLLEYCIEYSDQSILTESFKDAVNGVIKWIKNIIAKMKEIFGKIVGAIKNALSKIKFRTDKNGKLTKETEDVIEKSIPDSSKSNAPYSGKFQTLYDLAGVELDNEVSYNSAATMSKSGANIVSYEINVEKAIRDIKKAINDLQISKTLAISDDDVQRDIAEFEDAKEAIDRIASDESIRYSSPHEDNVKTKKLTEQDIKNIIEISSYNINEIEKNLKYKYDDNVKLLEEFQNKILNPIVSWTWGGQTTDSELNNKNYTEFTSIATSTITAATKALYQIYTNYCKVMRDSVENCCTVRKQLEAELLKKRKEELMG